LHPDLLITKLKENVAYYDFLLTQYFKRPAIPWQPIFDELQDLAKRVRPMIADVSALLQQKLQRQENILFEGAQGTLLDIDHGTYPFVTSSNCVAGAAASGTGVGPQALHYVLGITKAYTTRVGAGPFPTELHGEIGQRLAERGNEFGSVTGRPRRCGWLDAVALKRAIQINGVSGLCMTKMDVMDGLETIKICIGYQIDGQIVELLPSGADTLIDCVPIYETLPGWTEPTYGIQRYQDLPKNAQAYLKRLEAICAVPIDIISTGPDREETIVVRHPFALGAL
jgi:adenylosuccinate synthase